MAITERTERMCIRTREVLRVDRELLILELKFFYERASLMFPRELFCVRLHHGRIGED